MSFLWRCPFCDHNATIVDSNYAAYTWTFNHNNKYGNQSILAEAIVCPNPKCREYTLKISLFDYQNVSGGKSEVKQKLKHKWALIPSAEIKNFPDYIPLSIIADYKEACLIKDLSPKASATLSRRCLQGMIRDFWGISKSRLIDEISELQAKLDPSTWAAIDAVRKIGNIAAHMEKDIDLIIDIEPNEAQLLIGLIEILFKEWYIVKHEREQNMSSIVAMATSKDFVKQQNNHSP